MDALQSFLERHFFLALGFLALGLAAGLLTSLQLLGMGPNVPALGLAPMRSLHISLMLYGFFPLMLSYLPFLLIEKETRRLEAPILHWLGLYAVTWYLFLILMSLTLASGDRRGLPFYDFDYRLNFVLALAGVFYIVALFKAVRRYEKLPLWVRVSLGVTVAAPVLLLVLMNPVNGPVTQTLKGPHGDNTLGMSFALIPLYYLVMKTLASKPFVPRWHWAWIVPLVGYLITLLWRWMVGPLSYGGEWVAQWLTLLYLPLLWRWWRDAALQGLGAKILAISLLAFAFVDLEGNLLFIPQIRWIFHRNDLVVGHAHLAMGLGVGFLALALYGGLIERHGARRFVAIFASAIATMAGVLTIAGFIEAGYLSGEITLWWKWRSFFGAIALASLLLFLPRRLSTDWMGRYNLLGFFSDGLGAVLLLFGASWLYALLGWPYERADHTVIFAFMGGVGTLHWLALRRSSVELTRATAMIRLYAGAAFLALALSGAVGMEGWLVGAWDLLYAYLYFGVIGRRCNVRNTTLKIDRNKQ